MKLKKSIIKNFIIISILLTTPTNVFAHTNSKDISIDPIFTNEDGLWHPGRVESKDFSIKNNRKEKILVDRLSIELNSIKDIENNVFLDKESKKFKELSKNTVFKLSYKGNILFESDLDEIISKNNIVLPDEISINPKDKAILNMTVDMNEGMGNDAQSLENIFNIGVTYKVEDNNNNPNVPEGQDNNNNPNVPGGENIVPPNTNVDGSSSNKLPQTGGIINSISLIGIGFIAVGTGTLLSKKSKGGDKHNE